MRTMGALIFTVVLVTLGISLGPAPVAAADTCPDGHVCGYSLTGGQGARTFYAIPTGECQDVPVAFPTLSINNNSSEPVTINSGTCANPGAESLTIDSAVTLVNVILENVNPLNLYPHVHVPASPLLAD